MTDWGGLYREHVVAIGGLARALTADQLRLAVPATPAWTVNDVLAHLAGIASDVATGRMEGAPGPEWTARHVSERVALPVEDLVAEMVAHLDAVGAAASESATPAVVWDVAVHHADLREALGLEPLAEELWRPVLEAVGPMTLGPAGVDTSEVGAYEVFRAVFSRRSRAQVEAWDADVTPQQLERMCVFGVREDDQPVP